MQTEADESLGQRQSWVALDHFAPHLMRVYIGEDVLRPKPIAQAVRRALGLRPLRTIQVFYYGQPDARLRALFGYPDNERAKQ